MKTELRLIWLAALLCVPGLVGCESGSSDSTPGDGDAPSMTGNWNGTFGTGAAFQFSIVQSGDALSGGYTSPTGVPGSLTGSVSGNSVSLTTTIPGGSGGTTAQFGGTVNSNRTEMSGTFVIVAGGGGSGTWTATK